MTYLQKSISKSSQIFTKIIHTSQKWILCRQVQILFKFYINVAEETLLGYLIIFCGLK